MFFGFIGSPSDSWFEFCYSETTGALLATKIQGLPYSADMISLGFDIRVTSKDRVTVNLYKFVLGNPNSPVAVFTPGSDYMKQNSSSRKTQLSMKDNNWPSAPRENPWCHQCPLGFYSTGVNSFQCSPCHPGSFANIEGSCRCTSCLAGTFTYNWGSRICR